MLAMAQPLDSVFFLIRMVLVDSPVFICSIVALLMVISRSSQLRGAATPAIIGFGLASLWMLINPLFRTFVIPKLVQTIDTDQLNIMFGVYSFVGTLVMSAFVLLMLTAILSRPRTSNFDLESTLPPRTR